MILIPSIPRESKEYLPVDVTLSGGAVSSNVQLCALPDRQRPIESDWAAAVIVGSDLFVLLNPVAASGLYTVWARVTTASEKPVVESGVVYRS